MQSLFDESPQPEAQVRCIECSHFEGSKRDRGAFLFARRSGYCNVRIKRGDWNVLQRIDTPRQCKDFQEADEKLRDKRAKALAFYSKKLQEKS